MQLCFRKLNPDNEEDIRQFNELMDDLSQRAEDQKVLKQKIEEINGQKNSWLMLAEDVERRKLCGSVIGVLFGDFCGSCQPVMVVENVVVHHQEQRKGIGRLMLQEIERWGKEHNASYVILCSGLNRTGAHEFYRSMGYGEVKGFKKYLK